MWTLMCLVLAPAFFWLWYFHRKDHRPEPISRMALAFVLGALVSVPIYMMQEKVGRQLPPLTADQPFMVLWLGYTLLAGIPEEMAKFMVVLCIFRFHPEFDEPVDGLMYTAAVAIGMTAAEDLIYHLSALDPVRVLRPPAHLLISSIWGYALGRSLHNPSVVPIAFSLLAAMFLHGLWDALVTLTMAGMFSVPLGIFFFLITVLLFGWLEHRLADQ